MIRQRSATSGEDPPFASATPTTSTTLDHPKVWPQALAQRSDARNLNGNYDGPLGAVAVGTEDRGKNVICLPEEMKFAAMTGGRSEVPLSEGSIVK